MLTVLLDRSIALPASVIASVFVRRNVSVDMAEPGAAGLKALAGKRLATSSAFRANWAICAARISFARHSGGSGRVSSRP